MFDLAVLCNSKVIFFNYIFFDKLFYYDFEVLTNSSSEHFSKETYFGPRWRASKLAIF